jgi:hypothetical protein
MDVNIKTVTLYRRNNNGIPCFWRIGYDSDIHAFRISHGIMPNGKVISTINPVSLKYWETEFNSRIADKRKQGYKYITEIKDNTQLPVEGNTADISLFDYVNTYLPVIRTSGDNTVLPMLAKTFDNTNNKLFNKCPLFYGQYKINGLRCFISAKENVGDMFNPIKLIFQSREGTYWNSLSNLEEYLLSVLPTELLSLMINDGLVLDGELYLPGHSINEINHFVKDPKCPENKLIQYWCYDIAIEDTCYNCRMELRYDYLKDFMFITNTVQDHLSNKKRLVTLEDYDIVNEADAVNWRNNFIDYGFEGLIIRNPNKDYQYGARNASMIKFKRSTDGKFKIKDIYPEPIRHNIPIFLLINDINGATFEVHVGGSIDYQENILKNKEKYIGKMMYVEYGERSGVNQVPFHVKHTFIIPDK